MVHMRIFQLLSILWEDTVATTSHPEMETQKPTVHGSSSKMDCILKFRKIE